MHNIKITQIESVINKKNMTSKSTPFTFVFIQVFLTIMKFK